MSSPLDLARLESRIDFLETELTQLHELLIECGFPQGLITLKQAAKEILRERSFPKEL